MRPWEQLLARLRRARSWPLRSELAVHRQINLFAALRESDEPYIRQLMGWPKDRPLIIDPLAPNIAAAYGSLLFGRAPRSTPANDADADLIRDLTDSWAEELPAAEETCTSEGEVWWRLRTVPDLPHPVLSWHSRLDVVPLLAGRTVTAVAFVDKLDAPNAGNRLVYRHVELHGRGVVINLLFRGREGQLGEPIALDQHPETADLAEMWETGVDELLAGRVVNRWGRKPKVGVSMFNGVWTWFLTLNEAATIGRENLRLTGKKRVVVPKSAVSEPRPPSAVSKRTSPAARPSTLR